ncbi:MAG: hypothetical protein AAF364_08300 [Pseudomonadota bacterium]|uniref:hypothetical protein n=1 Tax=Alteromonas sp. 009811495 TaxID=3002962 RepID=UPI00237DDC79|nr:hypothetical protein [Alteromonas sp. 009811495]WDT84699.1 hypothetical protein OZ660_12195 [Alteromonas sp. 009811495]
MNSEQESVSLTDKILKHLTAKRLVGPAIFLGCIASLIFVLLLIALAHATLAKLDANTEYAIKATTQVVRYLPNTSSIPVVNLAEFHVVREVNSCPQLKRAKWQKHGELKFYDNAIVTTRLMDKSLIQINIQPIVKEKRVAEFIFSAGRCVLKEKTVFNIRLSADHPDFMMILVGDVTIGKQLSYDTRTMPLLLQSGQIRIKDKSFWFEDTISLPDVELSMGDTVIIPADDSNATNGLLTVTLGDTAFDGVFYKKGGQLRIVKPFADNDGDPIEISFFERLYSDNALAIAISASFIIIQLLMYVVNTLIRLTLIPKPPAIGVSDSLSQKKEQTEKHSAMQPDATTKKDTNNA